MEVAGGRRAPEWPIGVIGLESFLQARKQTEDPHRRALFVIFIGLAAAVALWFLGAVIKMHHIAFS
jgi:hypothetical protein